MDSSRTWTGFEELGKSLRSRRIAGGLTVTAVGTRIGRYHSFVSRYENSVSRLDLIQLRLCAAAVDVSIGGLVRELLGRPEGSHAVRPDVTPIDPGLDKEQAKQVIDEWCLSERLRLAGLLRDLRERAGLKEAGLAERINEEQPFVSKYENSGRRVDLIELEQIAEATGTTSLAVVEEFEAYAPPVPLVLRVGDDHAGSDVAD